MIVNIVIGGAIFGYASYTIFRHVQKSSKGKCANCAVAKSCESSCESISK